MATSSTVPVWRRPAFVLAAGCLMGVLTFGIRGGFGLFLEPISSTMGWGREIFAMSLAIQNLLWGLSQPVAGAIADRYGAGRVLAAGGVLYAGGVYLMAVSSTPGAMYLTAGLLVGMGVGGASFAVVLSAMARVVSQERRSLVLGIGTAAGSVGQVLLVPLGGAFIAAYGWQTALVLLSLGVLLVVPLAVPLAGRPGSHLLGAEQTLRQALREAFRHSGFNYLTIGFFVCGFHVMFIAVHLPAFVVDQGLDAEVGAIALALVGATNIVGSYLSGYFGGFRSKKNLLSLIYLARAIVITLFVLAPVTELSVYLFSIAIGFLWLSTVPLTSGLVAQLFGLRYMATLFGIVFLSHQLGSFLGVWLGGYLYDATGSYDVVWWLAVGLGLAAAAIHWPIDERAVARQAAAE